MRGPASAVSVGTILGLARRQQSMTRGDLIQLTGLSRSAVAARLDPLLRRGLLIEAGTGATGGRPAERFEFNAGAGIVLAADFGATRARLAVADLTGTPLAERTEDMDIAAGPDAVLGTAWDILRELARESGRELATTWGVGVGVPGPVDFARGQAVRPPIMPGWDGFDIPGWFAGRVTAAVLVDNDVNVMALGEHRHAQEDKADMIFVKVGTGIGSGLVLHGSIYRGSQGAAGDIGHVRVGTAEQVVCGCGNTGCLETVAGGRALARQLSATGVAAENTRDVVRLVAQGEARAVHAVRQAGRHIGEALATVVNVVNPQVIVIGGDLAEAREHLLAGIREVVYRRSTALATEQLRITVSRLADRAGIAGCAALVLDSLLAPGSVDAMFSDQPGTEDRTAPPREPLPVPSQ